MAKSKVELHQKFRTTGYDRNELDQVEVYLQQIVVRVSFLFYFLWLPLRELLSAGAYQSSLLDQLRHKK